MRTLLSLMMTLAAAAAPARAGECDGAKPLPPAELVAKAEVIVRATALGYFRPPTLGRLGRATPDSTIAFRVDEVLKGPKATKSVTLPGVIGERKENAPECVATTYERGATYLLLLKDGDVDWAPLSPTNERVRGASDKWLTFVKNRVESPR